MARTEYTKVRYTDNEKEQFLAVSEYYDLSVAEMVRLLIAERYNDLIKQGKIK